MLQPGDLCLLPRLVWCSGHVEGWIISTGYGDMVAWEGWKGPNYPKMASWPGEHHMCTFMERSIQNIANKTFI